MLKIMAAVVVCITLMATQPASAEIWLTAEGEVLFDEPTQFDINVTPEARAYPGKIAEVLKSKNGRVPLETTTEVTRDGVWHVVVTTTAIRSLVYDKQAGEIFVSAWPEIEEQYTQPDVELVMLLIALGMVLGAQIAFRRKRLYVARVAMALSGGFAITATIGAVLVPELEQALALAAGVCTFFALLSIDTLMIRRGFALLSIAAEVLLTAAIAMSFV